MFTYDISVIFLRPPRGASGRFPRRIGLLPGSFHPPTRAHLALAGAALERVDGVVLVLPRRFPHKDYDAVDLDRRAELLLAATETHPRFAVAISDGGLFVDMARECRAALGAMDVALICGRDAAERLVAWPYEPPDSIDTQLREYSLLVAARRGTYSPPERIAHRIETLRLDEEFDEHSATEVRQRIAGDGDWRSLVPPSIAARVAELYS